MLMPHDRKREILLSLLSAADELDLLGCDAAVNGVGRGLREMTLLGLGLDTHDGGGLALRHAGILRLFRDDDLAADVAVVDEAAIPEASGSLAALVGRLVAGLESYRDGMAGWGGDELILGELARAHGVMIPWDDLAWLWRVGDSLLVATARLGRKREWVEPEEIDPREVEVVILPPDRVLDLDPPAAVAA